MALLLAYFTDFLALQPYPILILLDDFLEMQKLFQVFDEFGFKVPDVGLNLSFNHALLGLEVRLPFYLVMDFNESFVL